MIPPNIARFGSISLGLCVGSLFGAEPKSHVLFMGADLAVARLRILAADTAERG